VRHRNVLHAAITALALFVGCNVYDASLVDDPGTANAGTSGASGARASGGRANSGAAGLRNDGTLTWNIAAQGPGSTNINLSSVYRVGLEINAAPDSVWSNPTLVSVDSITVSSPSLSFSFASSSSVNPTPSIQDVSGQALWLNAYTEDTTASNVTLGWTSSCP